MSSSKLPYGNHQAKGKQFEDWLQGRDQNTLKVTENPLKYSEIPNREKISNKLSQVDSEIIAAAKLVGLLKTDGNHYSLTFRPTKPPTENYWEGLVTPGAIFLTDVTRVNGPYISEVSLAAYNKHFPTTNDQTLKHIFMMYCTNADTKDFIQEKLCKFWPPSRNVVFEPGSDEYRGILGTELGKTAASIVLGGFKPGTVQISAITVWETDEMPSLRFDIKPAEKSSKVNSRKSQKKTSKAS